MAFEREAVDGKLTEFPKSNGGMPPNIVYFLIDDIGCGDMGIPKLNAIRWTQDTKHQQTRTAKDAVRSHVYGTVVHADDAVTVAFAMKKRRLGERHEGR